MRKLLCVMLVLLTVFMCYGCTTTNSANTIAANFYYVKNELQFSSDAPVLTKLVQNIKAQESDYTEILRIYLNGPTTYDCISPFPGGTELVDWYIEGTRAYIVLSPHVSTLPSVKQAVACACLARTIFDFVQADSLQIKIDNGLICGKESISFYADSFAFFDSMTPDDAVT